MLIIFLKETIIAQIVVIQESLRQLRGVYEELEQKLQNSLNLFCKNSNIDCNLKEIEVFSFIFWMNHSTT